MPKAHPPCELLPNQAPCDTSVSISQKTQTGSSQAPFAFSVILMGLKCVVVKRGRKAFEGKCQGFSPVDSCYCYRILYRTIFLYCYSYCLPSTLLNLVQTCSNNTIPPGCLRGFLKQGLPYYIAFSHLYLQSREDYSHGMPSVLRRLRNSPKFIFYQSFLQFPSLKFYLIVTENILTDLLFHLWNFEVGTITILIEAQKY